jgi:Zn-dependent peptidase ImmA (M78 family)/transcriptional regulator with XRE-family HTH domain
MLARMAQTVRVEINPEVLRWARELGGFTVDELARATGTKPGRVEEWEEGELQPTLRQLREIAWALRRPTAFFLLAEVPQPDLPQPPDFRSAPDQHEPSIQLRRELRAAVDRRSHYLDLVPDVPRWELELDLTNPAVAARQARKLLGVSLKDQLGAKTPHAALNMWVAAIEHLGVLVFQSSAFDLDEARGASVHFPVLPVILINAKDPPVARCFTLVHELGHLLMGSGALCEIYGRRLPGVERTCNQFAAALLMPAKAFIGDFRSDTENDDLLREVSRLARRYNVSAEAAAIRLFELHQIDRQVLALVQRETRNRVEQRPDGDPPRIPRSVIKLRDLGRNYVGAVLDAYHADRITLTDASQYLDVKVPHIRKMEERLYHAPSEAGG